jgi:alkylhydroperoxidase/carboxymuconolactone decarboxylase family protein YurZ
MKFSVPISPWKVTRILIVVVICLIVASLIGQFSLYFLPDFPARDAFAPEFNVDEEGNFPSLYSALTLLLCSILLATIAWVKKIDSARYAAHWKALSFIFLYLSIDEMLSLHERIMEPLRRAGFSGFLYHAWVVPGAVLLLIFVLAFLKFLFHLPAKTRHWFIVSGAIYVSGALGVELFGGNYADLHGQENMMYAVLVTIEEFMEMLGIIVFIHTLMSYMNRLGIREFNIQIPIEQSGEVSELKTKKRWV